MQRIITTVVICSLMFLSFGLPEANAGKKEDILALQQKVNALESQLGTLSKRTGQTDADATLKISQLERENQQLTGQVEAMRFELSQMKTRLDQVTRVLAGENFSGLEGSQQAGETSVVNSSQQTQNASSPVGDGGTSGSSSQAISGQTASGPVTLGPIAQERATQGRTDERQTSSVAANGILLPTDQGAAYNYASNFLLTGDYIKARQAFELYVQTYPNSPQTPDARFRLGEIYLATGANSQAAQAFIGHIRDYPQDPKAAEAYLKLGMSFSRLEQPDQACQIFKQVRSKYPNASTIVLSRTELEMQRINCR